MTNHRKLIAWQRCHALAVQIYKGVKVLPREELYGLTDQIKRAAVSAPANIAEGYARRSAREFRQFLRTALASLAELDALLLIVNDAELASATWYDELSTRLTEASKTTFGLFKAVGARGRGPS